MRCFMKRAGGLAAALLTLTLFLNPQTLFSPHKTALLKLVSSE